MSQTPFYRSALVFVSALLSVVPCTRSADQVPTNKLADVQMEFKKSANETLVITKGFPYRKDITGSDVIIIHSVSDNGVFKTATNSVQTVLMGGWALRTKGSTFFAPMCTAKDPEKAKEDSVADAVSNTWVFANAETVFRVGKYEFRAKTNGSLIVFGADTVVVKGFEVIRK